MSTSDADYSDDGMEEYDDEYSERPSDKPEYRLTHVLKSHRTTSYATKHLYDWIIGNEIDMEPEYQRDVVWPETKQIALIDSIFRNYYIPPIIFVAQENGDGLDIRTCIDGKQRLTSIQRFFDGQIPHKDPHTREVLWYKLNPMSKRKRGKLLPDALRRQFAKKQIICVEYSELDDSDEREIFQRVQLGMALTPAEKLQVISSPMASFVRQLEATYFAQGKPLDNPTLEWDRSRGADFRCIAQSLYCIAKYPSMTWGTVPQLEKWLKNPTKGAAKRGKAKKTTAAAGDSDDEGDSLASDEEFRKRAEDTFRVFGKLVADANLAAEFLREGWKVSPVEFITIALFIAVHKDRMPLARLARRLRAMREHTRAVHVDIRMNQRVAKTFIEFIINESTAVVAEEETETPKSKSKRKRFDDDVDMESRSGSRERKEGRVAPPGQTFKMEPPSQQQQPLFHPSPSPVGTSVFTPPSSQSHPQSQSQSQFGSSWLAPSSSSGIPPPSRGLAALQAAKESIGRTHPSILNSSGGSARPSPSVPRSTDPRAQGR